MFKPGFNERERIAALKAGATPSMNDWPEAALRPKLRAMLEALEKKRCSDIVPADPRLHRAH